MRKTSRGWALPFSTIILVFVGVFVLPFFVPTPHTASVSSSNDVGFSNKFASIWACLSACAVFGVTVLRPRWVRLSDTLPSDTRRLPRPLTLLFCCLSLAGTALLACIVHTAHVRYQQDAGYFINQMSSYAVYHRHVWSQIEFPYGPLLFYPPILLQRAIGASRISLNTCYFFLLVLEQAAGLFFLIYLVNRLPLARHWRIGLFLFGAVLTCQPLLGMNYTLFRFLAPFAALLFSVRRRNVLTCALCVGAGEFLNLSISSEMGFAFGAGAVAYFLLQMWRTGKEWAFCALAPPVAAGVFLLWVGRPFLQMLELFAGGTFNLIVRPLPCIVVMLVALVWLLPTRLGRSLVDGDRDVMQLGALFVVAAALVPVALGRADAPHVLFNGLGLFLLSGVAASRLTRGKQAAWAACMAISLITGMRTILNLGRNQLSQTLRQESRVENPTPIERPVVLFLRKVLPQRPTPGLAPGRPPFHLEDLKRFTGSEPVATPEEVRLDVEEALQRENLYLPSYFYNMTAVLDRRAEERKIDELNQAHWALLPGKLEYTSEIQGRTLIFLHRLMPGRKIEPAYIAGELFTKNLETNWRPVGLVDGYQLYENLSYDRPRMPPH